MKRILFAGAVMVAGMGYALAADLPPAAPPPRAPATYVPTIAPVYNWGGFYIGANGGYSFGSSTWTPGTSSFNVNGAVAGGTVGANFQTGSVVFGIEGDWDWSNITGSTTAGTAAPCLGTTCTTADSWLATLRGRVGYAVDRVLIFGTAGGAFGDIKASIPAGTTTTNKAGWTAGGGLEFAITDNITAKGEYLFVDLTNGSCTVGACGAASPSVKFYTSVIRAGLNFKFGGF